MAVSLVAGLVSATGAAIAAGGMTLGAFVATTAAFTALGAVSRALMPKGEIPTLNAGQGGTTVSAKNSIATRRLIYGRTRVGGTIVFSGTEGQGNQYLYHAYAIADTAHTYSYNNNPVAALEGLHQVYFNDELVATYNNSTNTFTYESGWAGTPTTESPYVYMKFYDGSQTSHDPSLYSDFNPAWTTSHKLQGIAYVMVRLRYDQEKFANGMPNVSFVVDGRKVYDPRKDSTSDIYDSSLGVSSHRENQPQTWTFSNIPALCLLDYMRDPVYGLDEPMDSFDLDALETAINICDDDVTLLSTTHKRYTCDGVIDSGNKLSTNIENILTSMVGKLYYSSGKFFMSAVGDSKSSESTTITEDMMVGGITLATKTSRRNQYNTVKGQFNNEDANYVATDYPIRDVATYIGEDGEPLTLDVDLPMTTNHYRAQRIAYITLVKSRQQATINLKLNLTGMRFKVGDNVKITYSKFGYVEKVFEIQHLQIIPDPELGVYVDITAVEDDPNETIYDTSSAIDVPATQGVNSYDGKVVPAPTSIDAYFSVRADALGNTTPKLEITIDDNPSPYITHYQLYVYKIPYSGASGHERYLGDAQEFTLTRDFGFRLSHVIDLVDRRTGVFRITCQAVNISGVYSDITTDEFEITEENRAVIVRPQSQSSIIIKQTDPLTEPTEQQIEDATVEHDLAAGDELIYQQVDADDNVVDSIVYSWHSDLIHTLSAVYSAKTPKLNPNIDTLFVDVFIRQNYDFGYPDDLTISLITVNAAPITQNQPYNFGTVGTFTVYQHDDIKPLDGTGTVVDGVNVYRNDAFDFVDAMPDNFVIAICRFEVDLTGLQDFMFSESYKIRVTNGATTIETDEFHLTFVKYAT